jgi:hypothetical protein
MDLLGNIIQAVVALGIINVWVLRARKPTLYRGGDASNLRQEFKVYGLPEAVLYLVGFLKIGAAIALIVGIWVEFLVVPAAVVLGLLMVGALAMHMKVKDPLLRYLPAATVFLGCVLILVLQ